MLEVSGKILKVDGDRLVLQVHGLPALGTYAADVGVRLRDKRSLSPEQRRKVFALCRDIASWMGDVTDYIRDYMMVNFCMDADIMPFSLSDAAPVDMGTCRQFIGYLIDFCIRHGVPCRDRLYLLTEDTDRLVYSCLLHRKCAVCGRPRADIHHFDAIGMGRDRRKIVHTGMRVLPLCREHHTLAESIGKQSFMERYYGLCGIPLTAELARQLGLNAERKDRVC